MKYEFRLIEEGGILLPGFVDKYQETKLEDIPRVGWLITGPFPAQFTIVAVKDMGVVDGVNRKDVVIKCLNNELLALV